MGALTLKQYSYSGRPWELKSERAIDVLDSMLGKVRLYYLGSDLKRILPDYSLDLNKENWITDKIRYGYDGLKRQRLLYPAVIRRGKLCKLSWDRVMSLMLVKFELSSKKLSIILGNLVDMETSVLSKLLLNLSGIAGSYSKGLLVRENYILNDSLSSSKVCVLVGSNLRKELPLLYYSMRQRERLNSLKIMYFGTSSNKYSRFSISLGSNISSLLRFISGRELSSSIISRSSSSLFLIGSNVYRNRSLWSCLQRLESMLLFKKLNLNLVKLQIYSMNIICNELGFVDNYLNKGNSGLLYIVGSDIVSRLKRSNYNMVVYQGHHIGNVINKVDILLPSRVFLENRGSYLSILGVLKFMDSQRGPKGVFMDWEILNMLKSFLFEFNQELFVNLTSLRLFMSRNLLLQDLSVYKLNVKYFSCDSRLLRGKIYDYVSSFYELDLLSKASRWLLNKKVLDEK